MIISYAAAYTATAVVFFGLDFVWLSTLSTSFYRSRIGVLLLDQPNFGVAGIFYLVYVAGIVHFAVMPAVNGASWTAALVNGALLGLVAYGTYDMTNLATLKNWSVSVSVVDMMWGIILTATAATCAYLFTASTMAKAG
ncbi:MAG TPA: DUF2177 family protein [Xanthobacteraceae bacterium]|nr:DUF2177 family protein [Xanthobacteraceae bacterium]